MKKLRLASGDEMPALGLGTWKSDGGSAERAVAAALEIGYRHFDCAAIYGNEADVGRALAGAPNRRDLWVTSKLWNNAHEPDRVRPALERTLADLGLDHLDLYLIHWPIAHRADVIIPDRPEAFLSEAAAPLEATWRALEECVDAGLCRNVGVSNFSQAKLARILAAARIRPAVLQVEAHPYLVQPSLYDHCRANDVLITAYSPLGSPDRPDIMRFPDDPVLLEDPTVRELAGRRGCTPAQLLIAWAIGRETAVIPKSASPERLEENFAAAEIELDEDERAQLTALDRGFRYVLGSFWLDRGAPFTLDELWNQ